MDAEEIKNRYLLETDDIIFRSRGQTNTCIILKTDLGRVVAAAPLMTLRVTSENVLPDYLCWWINQSIAQIHFERHAKGTSVRMISREALESLEINLPPIAVQRQIVELALLGEHEQELLSRLATAEKKKLNSILIKTATEEK
jgi:restriction endonuclease S subunit